MQIMQTVKGVGMTYTLITGGSKGLGKAMAYECAALGQNLILTARSQELLEITRAEIIARYHVDVRVRVLDLTQKMAARELHEWCVSHSLTVSILINNAGFGNTGAFSDTDIVRDSDMVTVNCTVLTEITKYFLHDMVVRKEGKIMNVASTAAFQPGPYGSVYYASKAYVYSFSCALHEELRKSGVTVTVLCPGPTDTDFFKEAHMEALKLRRVHMMSAQDVAKAGVRAMMKGKREIIPGFMNKIMRKTGAMLPQFITLKAVKWMMKE